MKLVITEPGSVLPVVLETEITTEQAQQIQALIKQAKADERPRNKEASYGRDQAHERR